MDTMHPEQWPEDVPMPLSKAVLKPLLLSLLDPPTVLRGFDNLTRSAWPSSAQLNHYLVDCRGRNPEEEANLREGAKRVIAAANQDEEIRVRWDFLTRLGFVIRFGVYDDPGMSDLWLQIVRTPDAEARLRTSVAG
jgi:hypothetical protein